MSETFKRKIEDFKCENCGNKVKGNGYTDHCPKCLFSKHVDENPGDRNSKCGGKLEPISIAPTKSGYTIQYKCLKCGYEHSNKSAADDDVTTFIEKLSNAESLAKRLPPV